MKPNFKIIADGKDITEAIKTRLISLTVTDESGIKSDRAEIVLDDRDENIEIPKTGMKLTIFMGWEDKATRLGTYVVDSISWSGGPSTLTIEAKAAEFSGSDFKAPKNRSWHKTTIGEIVEKIAKEHTWKAKVSPKYQNIEIPHRDQNESNMNFLTRLANDFDAVGKPIEGYLVFAEASQAKTATGKNLEPLTIHEYLSKRATIQERESFTGVRAFYWDKSETKRKSILAGEEGNVFSLKGELKNKELAKLKAEGELKKRNRSRVQASFSVIGNPKIFAERKLILKNYRRGMDGEYICKKVTHSLDSRGFISNIESTNAT